MRVLGLLVLVMVFAVLPVLVLDSLVMPELESLKYTYSNAEEIANQAVSAE